MLNYNFFKSQNDSKQLLVMLHGFISDSTTYDSHIEQLSQHVNVLTIDLPGHGKDTSDMNDTWDFPYIAHALDEVLSQYDMYDVYLLGYSMGGRVAILCFEWQCSATWAALRKYFSGDSIGSG